MGLKVQTRFPGGNGTAVEVVRGDPPEVLFMPDPCGSSEALWFWLKIEAPDSGEAEASKLKLTLRHADLIEGLGATGTFPVIRVPGQPWSRLKRGEESRGEDGQRRISWMIPYPAPLIEVAWCFPYDGSDVENLVEKSKGFWACEGIGISQGGHGIERVSTAAGAGSANYPGLYFLARECGGETPGSWVVDGFLRHWAQLKRGGWVVWAVPVLDVDGVKWGMYGRGEQTVAGVVEAWGTPPRRMEARTVQHDLVRWKARCHPVLVLNVQAGGPGSPEGVGIECSGELSSDEEKWVNVLKVELKDVAASDFVSRVEESGGRRFDEVARELTGGSALTLRVPFGSAGGNVLTVKSYREIGQRVAQAVLKRRGK
ncbi:MAG TPA: hypothetical protein PKE55_14025 [Kiritimatiellia bacterium]|nr:hypothetical protein [Kiritimatiellia bacterium]